MELVCQINCYFMEAYLIICLIYVSSQKGGDPESNHIIKILIFKLRNLFNLCYRD